MRFNQNYIIFFVALVPVSAMRLELDSVAQSLENLAEKIESEAIEAIDNLAEEIYSVLDVDLDTR